MTPRFFNTSLTLNPWMGLYSDDSYSNDEDGIDNELCDIMF